jgi:hypothetical protein
MGQTIDVQAKAVGDAIIFETDRSITGQDGTSYAGAEDAAADGRFPGQLAQRLFAADGDLDKVWVASNVVVVERREPWDEAAKDSLAGVISDFFRFYSDAGH